jgi:Arc-like DNA binding domain
MARKPTELRPIMARLPEGLRRRLEREAKRNNRSMNAEIINRLFRSIEEEDELARYRKLIQETVNTTIETIISEPHERNPLASGFEDVTPQGRWAARLRKAIAAQVQRPTQPEEETK